MAVVPTVRLLITAIAVTPRLATTLHQLRVVIRLRIIRALRPLAATAVPRVVAIMVAAGAAALTAVVAAALTAVVADLMAVTADCGQVHIFRPASPSGAGLFLAQRKPCTFRDASCRSYNSPSRPVLNITEAGFPA